ncbi:hypothetical protein DPMN_073711 [Dreissena polymorpha]|uniref:Uncharacterized protein n=1 Tax=Dreissena polymorpha TaxID=45954 RepID=A0A9D4HDU6_DREPO|nr:hypothetical protein DPMN_073711 [Dreissena polymorpha]
MCEQILHELYESPGKGPNYLHRCILAGERRDDHFGNRLFNCLNVDVDSVKEFTVTVYVSSLCGHKVLQLVGD